MRSGRRRRQEKRFKRVFRLRCAPNVLHSVRDGANNGCTLRSERLRIILLTSIYIYICDDYTILVIVFVLFVVIPFIQDVRLHLSVNNIWTHQPGSHRRKATPELSPPSFCGAYPIIFIARRVHSVVVPFSRQP